MEESSRTSVTNVLTNVTNSDFRVARSNVQEQERIADLFLLMNRPGIPGDSII